jgi:hypothetical protein
MAVRKDRDGSSTENRLSDAPNRPKSPGPAPLRANVTWDAGFLETRRFEKRYSTDYLYLDPFGFAHTHYPTDSRWQLLDHPLTASEFLALPRLRGAFFTAGLSFDDSVACWNRSGDQAVLKLRKQDGVHVCSHIYDCDGREAVGRTFLQHIGERVLLYARFPAAGRWEFKLFAKARCDEVFREVGSFGFAADTCTDLGFPNTFGQYHGLDAALLEPLVHSLPPHEEVTLRIRVPRACDVQLIAPNDRWVRLNREMHEEGVWQCAFRASGAGPHRIMAKLDPSSSRYVGLVEYD